MSVQSILSAVDDMANEKINSLDSLFDENMQWMQLTISQNPVLTQKSQASHSNTEVNEIQVESISNNKIGLKVPPSARKPAAGKIGKRFLRGRAKQDKENTAPTEDTNIVQEASTPIKIVKKTHKTVEIVEDVVDVEEEVVEKPEVEITPEPQEVVQTPEIEVEVNEPAVEEPVTQEPVEKEAEETEEEETARRTRSRARASRSKSKSTERKTRGSKKDTAPKRSTRLRKKATPIVYDLLEEVKPSDDVIVNDEKKEEVVKKEIVKEEEPEEEEEDEPIELDVSKLRVVDLRFELKQRGLPCYGVKAVLAARLRDFLDEEKAAEKKSAESDKKEEAETPEKPEPEPELEQTVVEPVEEQPEETTEAITETIAEVTSEEAVTEPDVQSEPGEIQEPEPVEPEPEPSPEPSPAPKRRGRKKKVVVEEPESEPEVQEATPVEEKVKPKLKLKPIVIKPRGRKRKVTDEMKVVEEETDKEEEVVVKKTKKIKRKLGKKKVNTLELIDEPAAKEDMKMQAIQQLIEHEQIQTAVEKSPIVEKAIQQQQETIISQHEQEHVPSATSTPHTVSSSSVVLNIPVSTEHVPTALELEEDEMEEMPTPVKRLNFDLMPSPQKNNNATPNEFSTNTSVVVDMLDISIGIEKEKVSQTIQNDEAIYTTDTSLDTIRGENEHENEHVEEEPINKEPEEQVIPEKTRDSAAAREVRFEVTAPESKEKKPAFPPMKKKHNMAPFTPHAFQGRSTGVLSSLLSPLSDRSAHKTPFLASLRKEGATTTEKKNMKIQLSPFENRSADDSVNTSSSSVDIKLNRSTGAATVKMSSALSSLLSKHHKTLLKDAPPSRHKSEVKIMPVVTKPADESMNALNESTQSNPLPQTIVQEPIQEPPTQSVTQVVNTQVNTLSTTEIEAKKIGLSQKILDNQSQSIQDAQKQLANQARLEKLKQKYGESKEKHRNMATKITEEKHAAGQKRSLADITPAQENKSSNPIEKTVHTEKKIKQAVASAASNLSGDGVNSKYTVNKAGKVKKVFMPSLYKKDKPKSSVIRPVIERDRFGNKIVNNTFEVKKTTTTEKKIIRKFGKASTNSQSESAASRLFNEKMKTQAAQHFDRIPEKREEIRAADPIVKRITEVPLSPKPKTNQYNQVLDDNNYVMSDHDGDSDWTDDDSSPHKPIPAWAQPANLNKQVKRQQFIDPDVVFSRKMGFEEKDCNLENIFRGFRKRKRFTNRGSSGNWFLDHLKWKEEMEYKDVMGFETEESKTRD